MHLHSAIRCCTKLVLVLTIICYILTFIFLTIIFIRIINKKPLICHNDTLCDEDNMDSYSICLSLLMFFFIFSWILLAKFWCMYAEDFRNYRENQEIKI